MNIALILSGGTGTRLGSDLPKQYIEVEGKPIISYCLETLLAHEEISAVQIVADPVWQGKILKWMNSSKNLPQTPDMKRKFLGFSLPGENRQLSVLHGLRDILAYEDRKNHENHKICGTSKIRERSKDKDYVLIHDAARPLLTPELITACLNGAIGHDGAMPVLPMKDTVYFSEDRRKVGALLNRSQIYAGQAPEVFLLDKYYEANCRLLPERILQINGSTEPAILAGMDIAMVPGDERNFKITTRADLERFEKMVQAGGSR